MGYTIENNESDAAQSVLLVTEKGFDSASIDGHVFHVQPINQTQSEVYFQIED